jgi:membrane-bound metal-dependent hydrolase YbcI (DUF457 family)
MSILGHCHLSNGDDVTKTLSWQLAAFDISLNSMRPAWASSILTQCPSLSRIAAQLAKESGGQNLLYVYSPFEYGYGHRGFTSNIFISLGNAQLYL